MSPDDRREDRSREVACTLLRLARPLLERSGERIAAAEVTLLLSRLEAEPPPRPERRDDMWEIVIPRSDWERG